VNRVPAPQESALAGGASSPVRAGAAVGGEAFVQAGGRGAYAFDSAGRAYVDYIMAYGPLLFGHAHPALVSGLDVLASRGTVFGSTHAEEVRLAERVAALVPSMERLRFTSTGTEAMMGAARVARAFTGRALIARFAGNYHGHFDAALLGAGASAAGSDAVRGGIPPGTLADTICARYNDLADFDAQLAGRDRDLAAILVEPIAANMGLVLSREGFLEGLFERARRCGALVVFDEVITWPRFGSGGAQGALNLRPDLTALGKVLGGGFPLAAGGTFSGNPFCVALGHRVLDLIAADASLFARLDASAASLADGLRAVFAKLGLPYAVSQIASMAGFAFRPGAAPRDYDEVREADPVAFAGYYHAMRERGILLPPSPNELMFLSSEHGQGEIAKTLAAAEEALTDLRARGLL
jgi:glutamate-1-semialdehyde 2,1-aminomutase